MLGFSSSCGPTLVQPVEKPISVSTHSGLSGPPSRRAIVSRLGVPALGRVRFTPFWLEPYGVALGVGHIATAVASERDDAEPLRVRLGPFRSLAVGLGHFRALRITASSRVVPVWLAQLAVRAVARRAPFASVTTGVGHNEQPLAAVRRADIRGPQAIPFRIVPSLGQVPEYAIEPSASES
jgi:hypothetical protein